MTACIFANGKLTYSKKIKEIIQTCDLIIGAHGGSKHIATLGLKPHLLVGDMDSLTSSLWENDNSVEWAVWPQNKNKTDTELAIDRAILGGCNKILLFGGLGGRIDHALGNIELAVKYPGRIEILDDNDKLVALDSSKKHTLSGKPGSIVSILPFGSLVTKVNSQGLKYELKDMDMIPGTRGISNEMLGDTASIWFIYGTLLVYIEQGEID